MSKKIHFDEEDFIEIFGIEPPKAYEDIWELLEYAYKKGKLPHPNDFTPARITVAETPTVKKLLKIFENKVENKVTKYATAESKIWKLAEEIGFAKLSQWLLTEFGFAKLIKELKQNNLNELLAIKNKIFTSATTEKRQYIRDSFGLLKDVLAGASGAKGKSKNDVFIRISKEQRLKLKLLSEFLGITENLTAYVCLIYALNHALKDDEKAKKNYINARIYLNSDDGLIKNMDYHYKTIVENLVVSSNH